MNPNLCYKKCIVITTINTPTEAIKKYSAIKDFDLIIVADKKTNTESYNNINCIFFNIRETKRRISRFFRISTIQPLF